MNWEAVGAAGEILGALGVIVSIIYLAAQINANTRTMRANAGFEASHSWATFNEQLAHVGDDELSGMMRVFSEPWDSFSELERARVGLNMRALFQKLEGQYYLYRYDMLDEGIWSHRARWSAGLLRRPFFQTWWAIEKDQLVYSDEFVRALEAVEAIDVSPEALGRDQ